MFDKHETRTAGPLAATALVLLLALAFAPGHGFAQTGSAGRATAPDAEMELSTETVAAVQAVIVGQIEAFQIDDGALALSFAAPSTAQAFKTAEDFMTMVRAGYRPIYRPREFTFEGVAGTAAEIRQIVRVVGENEVTILALYTMRLQPDDTWRIGGVQTVEIDETEL